MLAACPLTPVWLSDGRGAVQTKCLAIGMFKETTRLDEGLFLELFPPQSSGSAKRKAPLTITK